MFTCSPAVIKHILMVGSDKEETRLCNGLQDKQATYVPPPLTQPPRSSRDPDVHVWSLSSSRFQHNVSRGLDSATGDNNFSPSSFSSSSLQVSLPSLPICISSFQARRSLKFSGAFFKRRLLLAASDSLSRGEPSGPSF